jgi:phosphoribosyl-ATP pyrophosphohydrolase/phosphoribosyl-AMP cyclohydrolase
MLIPSIDIMNGKAVQLKQGKEFVLQSERTPLELAKEFNRYGEVAVIDLDAALKKGENRELIKEICGVCDVRVGGGIRDVETGREFLKAGAKRLIVGTMATPEFLQKFSPQQVMVALDHKGEIVVDQGWENATGETVWQRAERLSPYCSGFLTTFVEGEGCLNGMDLEAIKSLKKRLKGHLTVAGGIAETEEIVAISELGIDVQVGMALYTGRIDPVDAVVRTIQFKENNLVPTIVQDQSGQVLMMAYSSKESLTAALKQGKGVYFSRSRNEIWEKGLTSGNTQTLISCRVDCDRDCLLFTVKQENAACHNETYSCFGGVTSDRKFSLNELFETLQSRKETGSAKSYTATLFADRRLLLKKIMEEAFEVVSYSSKENLRWEIADLIYFASVLAVDEGLEWKDIEAELAGRRR